jgi:hypothetical protein
MPFAFDPAKTLAVITAWPDGKVAPELLIWLHEVVGLRWRQVHWHTKGGRDVCQGYNHAVRFALKSEYDNFIFGDNDIRPDPASSRPFLFATEPVVSIGYKTENRRSWDRPEAFHCGLWRTGRSPLGAIKPPWFQWITSKDGAELRHCPCEFIRRRFQKANIQTAHAGWADHTPRIRHH